MSENFLRFKKKNETSRILKSLLYGVSVGLFSGGLILLLAKLGVLNISPIVSLPIGVAACLLVGGLIYFLLRKTDEQLAQELDREFGLSERVETMLAYKEEAGTMLDLQREDTEKSLAKVEIKAYKAKRLWISFVALGVGVVMFLTALIIPGINAGEKPEEELPFQLTEMQRVGLEVLIDDVKSSSMEEPYKTEISDELVKLLSDLESITTQTNMQARLAESMAYILASTSNSSSMTEIANSFWDTGDDYAKAFARTLNTSTWLEPDWGDYVEKLAVFRALYDYKVTEEGETPTEETLHADLKWKLESSARKMESALQSSTIAKEDALYMAIDRLLIINENDNTGPVLGLKWLAEEMQTLTYEESVVILNKTFDVTDNGIYDILSIQKVNTNVGEKSMTTLSTLFLVPLPAFERPEFIGSGSNGGEGDEEDKENNGSQGGGIGAGATYGSDDYVLDPATGEYVKYGTLLAKYNALMMAKLESGNYTEQQKEAIKKYFELLYSGIKKDEGSQR